MAENRVTSLLIWWMVWIQQYQANLVVPSCPPEAKICEFWLELGHHITMFHFDNNHEGGASPLVAGENNTWYIRNPLTCNMEPTVTQESMLVVY